MDFQLTAEQEAWQKQVRAFARQEIAPVAAEHDREASFPYGVLAKAVAQHLFAPQVPQKYGGLGRRRLEVSLYLEELYRADGGIADALFGVAGGADIWGFTGSEEQREHWLRPLPQGKALSSVCFTEPTAGTDAAAYQTLAIRQGDSYIITGDKSIVSNARPAAYFFVAAKTDPEKGHRGMSLFIVEADRPGLEFTDIRTLGLRARGFCDIRFRHVRIPARNLVGEEGQCFYQLMRFFDLRRMSWAARALGLAQGAFDAAKKYSLERVAFGKPISELQAIQFKLVDMAIAIEAARLLAYRAAWTFDTESAQSTKLAAMAKVLASRTAVDVAREAIQIHGWYGYTDRYPVERFYRDAKATEIIEATSEILRVVAARCLLKETE